MQETQILSGELVMLRTIAGHTVTNARPSSYSYYMATQHLIPPVCPYTTTLLSAR